LIENNVDTASEKKKIKKIHILKIFLYPFSFTYGIIVSIRNLLFDFGLIPSREFKIPVISVGNITMGGTGKTPHVEYLISILIKEFKIAVLSRGYKRKTRGFIVADENSDYSIIGDEPRQIKQKFPQVEVVVDANRIEGILKIKEYHKDIQVILLDDAYQHRYVTPGISILLIDYNRPLGKDNLFPVGTLRENPVERKRADIIIITKTPEDIKPIDKRIIEKELKIYSFQKLYFTTLKYGKLLPVFNRSVPINTEMDQLKREDSSVVLITGIADSTLLKKHIGIYCQDIVEIVFPDHYDYQARDMQTIIKRFTAIEKKHKLIITTEKDAMRFQHFKELDEEIKLNMFFIPITVEFLHHELLNFNNQIWNYVRVNKPDRNLYKK